MATPNDQPFNSRDSNFVVKLRLSGNGGTSQIRRVLLNRLFDENDNVSYKKLVEVAIRYAFPETETLIPADYEVVMTYYDVDNDCVTIASNEEFLDAIEQYASQQTRVLRITTDVKCTNPYTPLPDMGKRDVSDQKKESSATSVTSIQKLVETFVSMLAAAVAAMQLKMVYGDRPSDAYSKEVAAAALANMDPEQAKELNETAEKLVREVVGNIGLEEKKDEEPKKENSANEEAAVEEAPMERALPPPEEVLPFIHGRHTCDGCLTTPIVGLRYHAVNLPDYDLCAKCRDNYKGEEIKFETAELDRDRPFQERWRRKRARWAARRANNCENGHGGGRRRRGPHGGGPHGGPHGGPRWQRRRGRGMGHHHPHATPQGMEDALQEAIRRSLEEFQPTEAATAPVEAPIQAAVTVRPPRSEPDVFATVAVTATAAQSVAETEDVTDSDSEDEAKADVIAEVKVTPAETKPVEIEMKAAKIEDPPARVVDEIPVEMKMPAVVVDDEDEMPRLVDEEEIKVAPIPCGEILETPKKVDRSVQPSPAKTEFSDDADGNGSVARAIGQTLDKCASAIDAMMDEIRRDTLADAMSIETDIRTEVNRTLASAPPAPETVKEGSIEENESTKIIDGEEDEEDEKDDVKSVKSQKSEDGWQVVNDQIAGDETLARAAQLVGSALFESDMRSSEAQLSNSIGSFPSSVPTVTTEIPPIVLDRWSIQLTQLKELGFHDEAKCVEILERLNATNIGVGEDEEVTVTQVVNELLKN